MSLFRAYADNKIEPITNHEGVSTWLENSSFLVKNNPIEAPENVKETKTDINSYVTEEISLGSNPKKRTIRSSRKRKSKEKKKHKSKRSKHEIIEKNGDFSIDKTRNKEFLSVQTISRPSVPHYKIRFYSVNTKFRQPYSKRIERYFTFRKKKEHLSNSDDGATITAKTLMTLEGSKKDENFTGFKQEEDLTQITAKFNKELSDDAHNIKLWLDYAKFQDVVYQFEKSYRKGSIAKGLRVLAERKLAILDKGLNYNPENEELMRERLNEAISIYPSDELQIQLKTLVDKDQGNIILWQGYIESFQCSMTHCNSPAVINLYTRCLSILHKLRRTAAMEKSKLEENILKMLYQCGLFFKQSGLFEQLWTLLRLYLELNLSMNDRNKFNITSGFDDKQLMELEEIVLKSQLPLHELWLRIEKLRESCHWLPFLEDGHCEDPQRLVFVDDVAELIHPITMPENTFKMTATILSLLKIPLLPCRHCTMQDLGLDYVPWAFDSIESLLPIFYPLHSVDPSNKNLIIDSRLAVGPQYLNVLPGQEEYLNFILTTMENCADCLHGIDRIATTVWWMRFQKLLIILDRRERFKMPKDLSNKIKTNIKNLLKKEQNRNNLIYYCEHASIEREQGNSETCINIIQTSLKFRTSLEINVNQNTDDQTAACYLIRTLIETYLVDFGSGNRQLAIDKLTEYILEKSDISVSTDDLILEAKLKFKHSTLKLLQEPIEKLSPVNHFLPCFLTDFIMCHGWFLYLTEGIIACGNFIEDVLSQMDDKYPEILYQKEVLYEFYVGTIFKFSCFNKGGALFKILDGVLIRGVEKYSNNIFMLSILAKEQSITNSNFGCPWWKLKSLLLKTGRAFPILFLIIISNQRIVEVGQNFLETVTGSKYGISDNFKNRMLSLFREIIRPGMCTRRCGLIWRLYLQFVHAHFDPGLCRNVYYCAVEECPWLKALYIDAAIYIPTELAQIQDLIIEKQLRIHVTPEELDILRSEN